MTSHDQEVLFSLPFLQSHGMVKVIIKLLSQGSQNVIIFFLYHSGLPAMKFFTFINERGHALYRFIVMYHVVPYTNL